jgi:hypothetical protein
MQGLWRCLIATFCVWPKLLKCEWRKQGPVAVGNIYEHHLTVQNVTSNPESSEPHCAAAPTTVLIIWITLRFHNTATNWAKLFEDLQNKCIFVSRKSHYARYKTYFVILFFVGRTSPSRILLHILTSMWNRSHSYPGNSSPTIELLQQPLSCWQQLLSWNSDQVTGILI